MSLSQMTFDKVWTNPVDFPSYEANETQVRADMQYLFDKIKTCYNNHLSNEFKAENMPFTPTVGGVTSTDVQAAIEFVHTEAVNASAGDIPNGSINSDKLKQTSGEEAVVRNAIRNKAINTDKLDDGAVTYAKSDGLQREHTIVGPVTVAVNAWDNNTRTATVTVTGASASSAVQRIDYTPANKTTWDEMRDCNVWCVPTVSTNNQVVLQCDTIPSVQLSITFCIWD